MAWYVYVGIFIFILLVIVVIIISAIAIWQIYTTSSGNGSSSGGSSGGGSSNFDLRIVNNCPYTVWIQGQGTIQEEDSTGNITFIDGAPIPGYDPVIEAKQGENVDYIIPSTGIAGTRFWGKLGCDNTGTNCLVGDSQQYWCDPDNPSSQNPNAQCPTGQKGQVGGCPTNGCTPPIDSLFEATFACTEEDTSKCWLNPSDTSATLDGPVTNFDTSQVDGWTFPYKLEILNTASQCDNGNGLSLIDGSQLNVTNCPTNEDLSLNDMFPTTSGSIPDPPADLTSVDLRLCDNGVCDADSTQIVGCMAPCRKLTFGQPDGFQQPETSDSVPSLYMCCPADIVDAPGAVNPDSVSQSCTDGPDWCMDIGGCGVAQTQYVQVVRASTNGQVYSYAFDDTNGLHTCPAKETQYVMTLCPSGSSAYPANISS